MAAWISCAIIAVSAVGAGFFVIPIIIDAAGGVLPGRPPRVRSRGALPSAGALYRLYSCCSTCVYCTVYWRPRGAAGGRRRTAAGARLGAPSILVAMLVICTSHYY